MLSSGRTGNQPGECVRGLRYSGTIQRCTLQPPTHPAPLLSPPPAIALRSHEVHCDESTFCDWDFLAGAAGSAAARGSRMGEKGGAATHRSAKQPLACLDQGYPAPLFRNLDFIFAIGGVLFFFLPHIMASQQLWELSAVDAVRSAACSQRPGCAASNAAKYRQTPSVLIAISLRASMRWKSSHRFAASGLAGANRWRCLEQEPSHRQP